MILTTIRLEVDSYYEYFMNTFAWIMFDNTWELFKSTGLFALPIIFHVIGKFTQVREQGADEGNKGKLLVNWLENYLYITGILLFATCVPLFKVNFHIMDTKLDAMCGAKRTTVAPNDTKLGQAYGSTQLNGKSPEMPLWWAFVYGVSKGITNGLVNGIPCKPHLEELGMALNQFTLSDPMLRDDIAEFNNYCYIPAKNRFLKQMKNDGIPLNNAEVADIAWPGSKILLEGGFYGKYHAKYPKIYWSFLKSRDSGFGTPPEAGGFPICDDFWKGNGVIIGGNGKKRSLYYRILDAYPEELKEQAKFAYKYMNKKQAGEEFNDFLVRYAISPQKMQLSDGTAPYGVGKGKYSDVDNAGSGWSLAAWGKAITGSISTIAASYGAVKEDILAQPKYKIMKFSTQIIQPLLIALLTIVTPIIVIFGGYKAKPIILVSFAFFGLTFLTYIWEIVHWLESWMFEALYDSSTYSNLGLWDGINNQVGDSAFNLVIGLMYVVFPSVFFTFLGFVGFNLSNIADGAIQQHFGQSGSAGAHGTKAVLSGADVVTGGKSKIVTDQLR